MMHDAWCLSQVAEAEVTEQEIDETRERYRPVAYRGAIMYFSVRDFNVVDPMYQYSLQWFTNLFVQASALSREDATLLVFQARHTNL